MNYGLKTLFTCFPWMVWVCSVKGMLAIPAFVLLVLWSSRRE